MNNLNLLLILATASTSAFASTTPLDTTDAAAEKTELTAAISPSDDIIATLDAADDDSNKQTTELPSIDQMTKFGMTLTGKAVASDKTGPVKDGTLELDHAFQGVVGKKLVTVGMGQDGFYDVVAAKLDKGVFDAKIDGAPKAANVILVGNWDQTYDKKVFAVIQSDDGVEHKQIDWLDRVGNAGKKTGVAKDGKMAVVDTDDLFAAVADTTPLDFDDYATIDLPDNVDLTTFPEDGETFVAFQEQEGPIYTAVKPKDDGTLQLERYRVIHEGAKIVATPDENNQRVSGFTVFVRDVETGAYAAIGHNLPLAAVLEKIDESAQA